jgi:hypothetical protein
MKKAGIIALVLFAGMMCHAPLLRADLDEITSSTELSVTASTLPEARLRLTHTVKVPFLRGENPLVSGNDIVFEFDGDLTPVSMDLRTEIVWTPIAFFQLVAVGQIGSGWNVYFEPLDWNLPGIGINRRNNDGTTSLDSSPFDGLLWNAGAGGVFQFDLAAIFPGDWNHVVFRTYHEAFYAGYSRASKEDSWYFEVDAGENRNGWNYSGNYLIGYQMPAILRMAALMAEIRTYLYDTPNRELWGDGLGEWTFSAIFNFKFSDQFDVTLIPQLRTQRSWTAETKDYEFYQDRRLDSPERHLEFYRVAAIATFKLR